MSSCVSWEALSGGGRQCDWSGATALQLADEMSKILGTLPMQMTLFAGTSRDDIRAFPETARREVGRRLLRILYGFAPMG